MVVEEKFLPKISESNTPCPQNLLSYQPKLKAKTETNKKVFPMIERHSLTCSTRGDQCKFCPLSCTGEFYFILYGSCVSFYGVITFVEMDFLCVVASLVCGVNSFGALDVVADCVSGIELVVVDGFSCVIVVDVVDDDDDNMIVAATPVVVVVIVGVCGNMFEDGVVVVDPINVVVGRIWAMLG